ncbi:MAG: clostripain-related cysteine peptidase [Rikenellaceae bacterium]
MRRFIYLLIFTLIFTALLGCSKDDSSNEYKQLTDEVAPQTTLIYFAGRSLSSNFLNNISDIESAVASGALGEGRFIVFYPTTSTSATLYEIYRDGDNSSTRTEITQYSNFQSVTSSSFTTIINKAKEYAPADTYNIIISGHGTGWVPTTMSMRSLSSFIDFDAYREQSNIPTRYIGSSSNGRMEISDLKSALESSNTTFGYILFDACFMSSIEAFYDLRDLSDYIIASPCEVMSYGFPYEKALPYLFSDNGHSVDYEGVCRSYYEFYKDTYSYYGYKTPSGAIAVTVTKELEPLASVVKEINSSTINSVNVNTLQSYDLLTYPAFVDLGDYINNLCADDLLLSKFATQLEATLPSNYKFHTESIIITVGASSSKDGWDSYLYANWVEIEQYSGISTTAPSAYYSSYWKDTDWAKATTN